jgi:hypothetical protein
VRTLVREAFVPLWIDVRTQAIPPLPESEAWLIEGRIDERGRIVDAFSKGYFLRTIVVSPDGARLLNRQERTVGGSFGRLLTGGAFAYAQVDPGDYLVMLRRALAARR